MYPIHPYTGTQNVLRYQHFLLSDYHDLNLCILIVIVLRNLNAQKMYRILSMRASNNLKLIMWQVFRPTANKTTFIGFSFTVLFFHSVVLKYILLQYSVSYDFCKDCSEYEFYTINKVF